MHVLVSVLDKPCSSSFSCACTYLDPSKSEPRINPDSRGTLISPENSDPLPQPRLPLNLVEPRFSSYGGPALRISERTYGRTSGR